MNLITLNPNRKGQDITLSNNNLSILCNTASNANAGVFATQGKTKGKWYWEVSGENYQYLALGIANNNGSFNFSPSYFEPRQGLRLFQPEVGRAWDSTGIIDASSTPPTSGGKFNLGLGLDLDSGTLSYYVNGAKQTFSFTGINTQSEGEIFPYFAGHRHNVGLGGIVNFGASPFENAVPDGFLPYDIDSASVWYYNNKILFKSNNLIYNLSPIKELQDITTSIANPNSITEQEFLDCGIDPQIIDGNAIASLNTLDSFEVIYYTDDTSVSAPTINITAVPKPQLVLPKGDIQLPMLDKINNLTMYSNKVGGGDVKIVFSVDSGLAWKTYNSTTLAFEDVDISNIANVKNSGMTADTFNSIGTKWNEVVLDSKIRFIYYLEIVDISDVAEVDKLDVNIDMIGRWKKAVHGTDYDYEYDNTKLYVSLLTDGNYKINYQE